MIRYTESLTPSLPIHLALLILLPMGFGMLAPIHLVAGAISAVVLYALALVAFVLMAPRIVVTDTELRAGRATILLTLLGKAEIVEPEQRFEALGDARTWKVLRGWIPRGLLIAVDDPADPTPSWYVSTRHPEKLRAILTES
jgi:hypothetical protein